MPAWSCGHGYGITYDLHARPILEDQFKPKVVCAWLGNSEAISRKHYIQVTKQDYAKAVQQPEPATAQPMADSNHGENGEENRTATPNGELLRRCVEAAHQTAQSALATGDSACQLSGDCAVWSAQWRSAKGAGWKRPNIAARTAIVVGRSLSP